MRNLGPTYKTVAHVSKNGTHTGLSVMSLVADLRSGRVRPMDVTPLVVVRHARTLWAVTVTRRLNAFKSF